MKIVKGGTRFPKWGLMIGKNIWGFPIDPKKYFKEIEKGIRAKPFWWDYPTKFNRKTGTRKADDADKYWKKKAKEI